MADNVISPLQPNATVTVASDEVNGAQYQRVKQCFGVDGSATDVSSTNPLPVIASGTTPVSIASTVAVSVSPATTVKKSFQTIGLSAIQMTANAVVNGVTILADDDNTDSIYLGGDNTVTASGTTRGYRLKPGKSVFVPTSNANNVWVIGGAANQGVYAIGS